MMPGLKSEGEGRPIVSSEPVWEELTKYPWSDWPEAGLVDVVRYLRGNVNLRLPKEWKECFPNRI